MNFDIRWHECRHGYYRRKWTAIHIYISDEVGFVSLCNSTLEKAINPSLLFTPNYANKIVSLALLGKPV